MSSDVCPNKHRSYTFIVTFEYFFAEEKCENVKYDFIDRYKTKTWYIILVER